MFESIAVLLNININVDLNNFHRLLIICIFSSLQDVPSGIRDLNIDEIEDTLRGIRPDLVLGPEQAFVHNLQDEVMELTLNTICDICHRYEGAFYKLHLATPPMTERGRGKIFGDMSKRMEPDFIGENDSFIL